MKNSKLDRQAWWRSLTPEEQADYRCNLMERKGKVPNWDQEYSKVLQEGNYLR